MFTKLFGIGDISPIAFTQLVAKVGRERGAFFEPIVDEDAMTIVDPSRTLNLGNAYQAFLATPRKQRLAYVETLVSFTVDENWTTWPAAKAHLIAVARHSSYSVLTQLAGSGAPMATRPLAPGIATMLALDGENAMALVTEAMLADWGISFEEALAIGLSALRTRSTERFRPLADGVFAAPWTDSYASARVLLPDVLYRVCSAPLVAMPTRDLLYVTDEREPDAFGKLAELIDEASREPYPLSRRIYRLVDGKLEEAEGDAHAEYWDLVVAEELEIYAREAELRNPLEQGFYPQLLAVKTEDGVLTQVMWTKGIEPTFLPQADFVTFIDLDGPTYTVRWTKLVELLTPAESLIPRWSGPCPSEAWLAQHGTKLSDSN